MKYLSVTVLLYDRIIARHNLDVYISRDEDPVIS
jgi:hypothetical protein